MSSPDPNARLPRPSLDIERPSKSADAARRQEIERTRAMTPRERVLLALSLGERLRHFFPDVARRRQPPTSTR